MEIVDSTGAKIKVPTHAERVVTLAPSLSELVVELSSSPSVALKRLVGVSEFSDFPPEVKKVRQVGPYYRVHLEAVLGLRPDLVLATSDGNSQEQVSRLREAGVPVVVVATQSLKGIEESISLVAQALGERPRGEVMLTKLRSGLADIRKRNQSRTHPKVLLQVGDEPLVVAGGKSFLHEALETVGAVNVYADAQQAYPKPSLEDALRRNADTILVLAMTDDLNPYQKFARKWEAFPSVSAVKNHRIKVIQGDRILRPTLRLLDGLKELEKAIRE